MGPARECSFGGVLEEALEELGLPATRPRRRGAPEREVGLEPPVDAVIEGALGDHALLHAGHVRGRDVDERGSRSSGEHAAVEVHRAEQVRLEALVDRRVEGDRRGGVDHDVDVARQVRLAAREVAVDDLDPLVQEAQERVVRAEGLARAGRTTASASGSGPAPRRRRPSGTGRAARSVVSGKSARRRSRTTWPRKPVTPVRKMRLPASRSTIELPAFAPLAALGRLLYHPADYRPLPFGRQPRCSRRRSPQVERQ